jgi:hypothetical protein
MTIGPIEQPAIQPEGGKVKKLKPSKEQAAKEQAAIEKTASTSVRQQPHARVPTGGMPRMQKSEIEQYATNLLKNVTSKKDATYRLGALPPEEKKAVLNRILELAKNPATKNMWQEVNREAQVAPKTSFREPGK